MVMGVVEIDNASVKHTMTASSSADTGANLPNMEVVLVAASIPITLGVDGDIQLERKTGKTSRLETESKPSQRKITTIKYRAIREVGWNWTASSLSGRYSQVSEQLTFQGEDKDVDTSFEDAKIPNEWTRIYRRLALLAIIASFMGEAVVYNPDTGFWYHSEGLPRKFLVTLPLSTFLGTIWRC